MPKMIETLDDVVGGYSALFCDVWGVIHNGIDVFEGAVAALRRAREKGVAVVLITNSPRRREGVIEQLISMGADPECWDRIVTSGDVTRDLISAGPRRVFHIGSDRDL